MDDGDDAGAAPGAARGRARPGRRRLGLQLEVRLPLVVDEVELVEELPIEQVPPGDVVVGRELLAHQPGVDPVDEDEDPLGHLAHGLGRVMEARGAELRQSATRQPAATVAVPSQS